MSYYDNVKDSVKDEKKNAKSSGGSDNSSSNFSTLREEAEKNDTGEGNDTPIEVLEEGGLKREVSNSSRKSSENSNSVAQNSGEETGTEPSRSVDSSSIEEKLDRIIEQNDRMIEILESFGN